MSQNNSTILKVNGLRALVLVLTLVFASAVTFGQSADVAKIEQLEKDLVTHFKSGKYKQALPIAKQLVALNETALGSKGVVMATAYTNLGLIERALEKYAEASVSFLNAINALKDVDPTQNVDSQVQLLHLLAESQNKDKKYTDSITTFDNLLGILEKHGKHESAGAFEILLGAANNQAQAKNFAAANELYKKTLKVLTLHFKGVSDQREKLLVYRTCYFSRFVKDENLNKDYADFAKEIRELVGTEGEPLNGKATELPRPKYPIEARAKNLYGMVYVWVRIDPQGNVSKAEVICSNSILGGAAIISARLAKFSPTILDGKPIEAFGLITYKFVEPKEF